MKIQSINVNNINNINFVTKYQGKKESCDNVVQSNNHASVPMNYHKSISFAGYENKKAKAQYQIRMEKQNNNEKKLCEFLKNKDYKKAKEIINEPGMSDFLKKDFKKHTGVSLYSEQYNQQALKLHETLVDWLPLYKKAGIKMPDCIVFDIYSPSACFSHTIQKDSKTGLDVLKYVEFKVNPEYANNATKKDLHLSIVHELVGHTDHCNNNPTLFRKLEYNGASVLLNNTEDKALYSEFLDKYKSNYKDLKIVLPPCFTENSFDTNKKCFENTIFTTDFKKGEISEGKGFNLQDIQERKKLLFNIVKVNRNSWSDKLNTDFSDEFIAKASVVINKLAKETEFIKEFKYSNAADDYAYCNPLETVAVATQIESDGDGLDANPWLSKKAREGLEKLGKPKSKLMSYYPDDRPADWNTKKIQE